MIGIFFEPFAGDIEVNTKGWFVGFDIVVNVYQRRVQEDPSDAFTHQRYVVPYERPETEHTFAPLTVPVEDLLPTFGRV